MDIKFISWNESQTQVIHALSMIISYLQRSNVIWCPTLVLLSQMRFLLLLSGSYGTRQYSVYSDNAVKSQVPSPFPIYKIDP